MPAVYLNTNTQFLPTMAMQKKSPKYKTKTGVKDKETVAHEDALKEHVLSGHKLMGININSPVQPIPEKIVAKINDKGEKVVIE